MTAANGEDAARSLIMTGIAFSAHHRTPNEAPRAHRTTSPALQWATRLERAR
jgi:hypothetical protein